MKIPNFENVDLAIFAVAIITLPITIIALFKTEGKDLAPILLFAGQAITGVIGLVKVSLKNKEDTRADPRMPKPAPPEESNS